MDLQIAAVSFAQMFHAIFYRNVSGLPANNTFIMECELCVAPDTSSE